MVKKIKKKKSARFKGDYADYDNPLGRIQMIFSAPGSTKVNLQSEQTFRLMHKMIQDKNFQSQKELDDFLHQEILGCPPEKLRAKLPPDPVEDAHELAFQAIEARSSKKALNLARKALELDPNCLDAQRLAAILETDLDSGRIEALIRLIARAEEQAGPQYFQENQGHFWGITETRPYMRLLAELVLLLIKTGRIAEAIQQCEKMLRLNPGDNQGMRDLLMGLYLETDHLEGVRKLLRKFPGDISAPMLWGLVLERFLSGDLNAARYALYRADDHNPYVLEFIVNNTPIPQEQPEFYQPGEVSEAIICLQCLGRVFQKHPEFKDWLKTLNL